MDKLQSLEIFRLVAEQGSFIAAANRLDISAGKTSKNIMALEAHLGVRLLNRTSRSLSLTEAGAVYLERAKALLDGLEETEAVISNTSCAPKGVLKITGPGWLATEVFIGAIDAYQKKYPEVQLDVKLSGTMVNLVEDGFDLALRCSPKFTSDYVARPIARIHFNFVAAPDYIQRRGVPKKLSELAQHALLWYSAMPKTNMAFPEERDTEKAVNFEPSLICDDEFFLCEAALNGMGVAFLPHWMTAKYVRQGRLQKLFEGDQAHVFDLMAMYPSRRYLSLKVRTFIDFFADDKKFKNVIV